MACFFAGECGTSEVRNSSTTNFSSLASQTSTFIKSNSQKTASDVMNIQSTNLSVENMGDKCEINLSQSINLSQQTSGELSATSLTDLRSMITTGLQNMATQNAATTAEMGSATLGAQSTTSVNETTVNTDIQNIVNTTCSDSNYNELVSSTLNKQDAAVKIKNCNGKLNIGQNIVADVIAKNLMDSVLTTLQTNASTANVFNSVGQSGSSTSGGFAGVIDSVLGGIAGIFGVGADVAKTYIIACVALLCLCCAGLVAFALSPAGQEASAKAVNAGINMAKQHGGGGGMKGPSGGGSPFM
jgi:hypothetical protein